MIERARLRARGAVQGVGFRPFAAALARRFALAGFALNDAEGVLIEIEGGRDALFGFMDALRAETPGMARLDALDVEATAPTGAHDFVILPSRPGAARTRIPPDAATCAACLDDLFDPASRFHRYPFVTCTHCGPRFTLTRALPYDRARTAMARFPLCEACARDYRDPIDRRFHAEAIACPACGPRLSHDVGEIVAALKAGRIVAVKGIGGFHLMCDARGAAAVSELRRRKRRDAKPFAVMVADAAALQRYAAPTPQEMALAQSPSAPIVLMKSRGLLPDAVAPGLTRLGLMLPYAPLHHLIFAEWDAREPRADIALVATSANPGGAPLIADDAEARERLADVADLIVGHDRAIAARADDSLVQVIDGAPAFLRRARGFVPEPIDLSEDGPCVLGCGGHLKATVTLTRGREAFVSQHIGDLSDVETARFHRETIARLSALLGVRPQAVACDLHPDYLSTRYAEETGLPLIAVQHHAAHVAAVAAEHGVKGQILGAALDGHGLGADGGAWGGELIALDGADWTRRGHLAPIQLIGADRAAREPWRMGLAALAACGRLEQAERRFPASAPLAQALRAGRAFPSTTSLGRLFDAAAALLGTRLAQDYEGQAAMELEALVTTPRPLPGGWRIVDSVLDLTPLLAHLIEARPAPREGAELLHGTLAAGLAEWIAQGAAREDRAAVALGGGCMMNRVLSEALAAELRRRAITPLMARRLPANDGGLSFGQAAMARAMLAKA